MDRKSSYFLYGYFGAGNFGDDVLLNAVVRNIVARDPRARFLIRNYGAVDVDRDFPGRVACTDMEAIHWSGRSPMARFAGLLAAYWRYMGRVSTLVVGGGTLIHDAPSRNATVLLTCLCLIARMRGCRVIGVGLGAQDIRTPAGRLLCRVLARSFHRLYLRDDRSFRQFQEFLPGDRRVVLSADLAYTMPAEKIAASGRIVAITLVEYIFTRAAQGAAAYEDLAAALAEVARRGYRLRFLSLQRPRPDLGVKGDRAVIERILPLMPADLHDACEIMDLDATAESMASCYDGVGMVAGMRFHSLVFAAMAGVPFVGLGDEPKVEEFCAEYGMTCLPAAQWRSDMADGVQEGMARVIDPALIEKYHQLSMKNFEDFI